MALPFSPYGPISPFSPLSPVCPLNPGRPGSPLIPVTPRGPVSPLGPSSPLEPGLPSRPRSPFAPSRPARSRHVIITGAHAYTIMNSHGCSRYAIIKCWFGFTEGKNTETGVPTQSAHCIHNVTAAYLVDPSRLSVHPARAGLGHPAGPVHPSRLQRRNYPATRGHLSGLPHPENRRFRPGHVHPSLPADQSRPHPSDRPHPADPYTT